jgi:ubiquinone/menaquinone biosynthesis C-methylase UbiE
MGLYRKHILPRLIDAAMQLKAATERRSQIVPRATGRVLDVGMGSGLNLPFYGPRVTKLWGIDPSSELLAMTRAKLKKVPFPVELLAHSAEEIPLPDASIDTVVLTWTLCSIPEPMRALREMRRVLAPGGQLLFAEHGLSPDRGVGAWQRRLTPVWRRIAGGCHLDRKVDDLLLVGGFHLAELGTSYLPGPRVLTHMYQGVAV